MSAYVENLDLAAAKKLFAAIAKPGPKGKWESTVEDGGMMIEERFGEYDYDFPLDELSRFQLPPYCSNLAIYGVSRVKFPEEVPHSPFLIGNELVLGPRGGEVFVDIKFFSKEINLPVKVRYTYNTQSHYLSKDGSEPDEYWEMSFLWGRHGSLLEAAEFGFPDPEDGAWSMNPEEDQEKGLQYMQKLGVFDRNDPGVLEWREKPGRVDIKMSRPHGWAFERYPQILSNPFLSAETDEVIFMAGFNYGSLAKFRLGAVNLRPYLSEVLERIVKIGAYPSFKFYYTTMVAEDWKAREARRKKMMKAKKESDKMGVLQEVGRLTQENGVVSQVKIRVEESGYTIILDFEDLEGYAKFPKTKLFKKAEWKSGYE
ncbi:MAG: hypothetical protein MUF31_16145 [Akkermansiaceae bacterium]|jgi:hypothetical protein|nr:hypothetical protein [Akkermansiaceae bacterium]